MDEISEGLIGSSEAPSNAGQGEQLSLQGEQTVLCVFRVLILNEHSAIGGTFSSLAVRAGTGVPIRIWLCLVVLLQNCLVVRQTCLLALKTKCGGVLSCHGRYYCFSPTLLPTRRELKLNCSRSRPLYEIALGRPNSDKFTIIILNHPNLHLH